MSASDETAVTVSDGLAADKLWCVVVAVVLLSDEVVDESMSDCCWCCCCCGGDDDADKLLFCSNSGDVGVVTVAEGCVLFILGPFSALVFFSIIFPKKLDSVSKKMTNLVFQNSKKLTNTNSPKLLSNSAVTLFAATSAKSSSSLNQISSSSSS